MRVGFVLLLPAIALFACHAGENDPLQTDVSEQGVFAWPEAWSVAANEVPLYTLDERRQRLLPIRLLNKNTILHAHARIRMPTASGTTKVMLLVNPESAHFVEQDWLTPVDLSETRTQRLPRRVHIYVTQRDCPAHVNDSSGRLIPDAAARLRSEQLAIWLHMGSHYAALVQGERLLWASRHCLTMTDNEDQPIAYGAVDPAGLFAAHNAYDPIQFGWDMEYYSPTIPAHEIVYYYYPQETGEDKAQAINRWVSTPLATRLSVLQQELALRFDHTRALAELRISRIAEEKTTRFRKIDYTLVDLSSGSSPELPSLLSQVSWPLERSSPGAEAYWNLDDTVLPQTLDIETSDVWELAGEKPLASINELQNVRTTLETASLAGTFHYHVSFPTDGINRTRAELLAGWYLLVNEAMLLGRLESSGDGHVDMLASLHPSFRPAVWEDAVGMQQALLWRDPHRDYDMRQVAFRLRAEYSSQKRFGFEVRGASADHEVQMQLVRWLTNVLQTLPTSMTMGGATIDVRTYLNADPLSESAFFRLNAQQQELLLRAAAAADARYHIENLFATWTLPLVRWESRSFLQHKAAVISQARQNYLAELDAIARQHPKNRINGAVAAIAQALTVWAKRTSLSTSYGFPFRFY